MTSKGYTQFLSKRQREHLENHLTCSVKAEAYSYSETLRAPGLRGMIKGYYVLFGTTGEPNSGHHIADFPPTEAGKAAAEECARAIWKAMRFVKNLEIPSGG